MSFVVYKDTIRLLFVCMFSPATFAVVDIVRDFRIISFRSFFLSCVFFCHRYAETSSYFSIKRVFKILLFEIHSPNHDGVLESLLDKVLKEYSIHSSYQQFVTRLAVLFLFFFGLRTYNGVYFKP